MISLITSSTTDSVYTINFVVTTIRCCNIFNSAPRRRYGDRLYISPIIHDNFLQTMQKPSGMHHIQTFVGKREFKKGTFVYFIFLNDNRFEKTTGRTVNVMDIFNSTSRRRYGDRLYTSPIIHDNFLQTMQKPSGMHHIIFD
jgi:hypothetical protein